MSTPIDETQLPPPVPPRPNQRQVDVHPYNEVSQVYQRQPFGMGPYGVMGPTPFMSPYGASPYQPFTNPFMAGTAIGNTNQSGAGSHIDFIRMAEENSRQAFQSIESIVQAFSSVSMMLESTYFAVHSSFRAVLGVAEHVTRLRDHLSSIMSAMAILKTLRWFLRRILYMLNLVNENPSVEMAWTDSVSEAQHVTGLDAIVNPALRDRSSWPIIMFLGVVFGTPWLIWRLVNRVAPAQGLKAASPTKWITEEDDHYVAEALHEFKAEQPNEISLSTNQRVIIAPKDLQPKVSNWILATTDGKKTGLVPLNYVKIVKFVSLRDQHDKKVENNGTI
ncbi:Peroxisomal membrane protein PEX13, partial [Fragariocoptes setiger]